MDVLEYNKRIAELEKENRILKKKLARNEVNRAMLEEMLETHSNTLKARMIELEESRELIRISEARYRQLAHRDELTGLPNRTFFLEFMVQGLSRAKSSRSCTAVFFIDLDRFKPINDNFGHDAGDIALTQIAGRLRACVENKGMVARIGGDEFAILLEDITVCDASRNMADKIINMMSKSFLISGQLCQIGASIGISLYPYDDDEPERLLHKADIAMYSAKKSGSNNYRFYNEIKSGSRGENCSNSCRLPFHITS